MPEAAGVSAHSDLNIAVFPRANAVTTVLLRGVQAFVNPLQPGHVGLVGLVLRNAEAASQCNRLAAHEQGLSRDGSAHALGSTTGALSVNGATLNVGTYSATVGALTSTNGPFSGFNSKNSSPP